MFVVVSDGKKQERNTNDQPDVKRTAAGGSPFLDDSRIFRCIALKEKNKRMPMRIIEASYGDKASGKTCKPDLSICKGISQCEFEVDDGLCAVVVFRF